VNDIDYDLQACLDNNVQNEETDEKTGLVSAGFDVENIARVFAVWEGENDEDGWRWILGLNDGRIVYLYGSCDYTGWDCRSGAHNIVAPTPELAAMLDDVEEVTDDLLRQIEQGKDMTWRQSMDIRMGINSLDPNSFVDLDGAL
jgi:hypothetical protein